VVVVEGLGVVGLGIIRGMGIGGIILGILEVGIGEDIMMGFREDIFIRISSSIMVGRGSLIIISSSKEGIREEEGTIPSSQGIIRVMVSMDTS
jgi:hypothetical protein